MADIMDVAEAHESLSMLLRAAELTGLAVVLGGEGPITLFAPNDAAFDHLPEGLKGLLETDEAQMALVLRNHIVEGELFADDLMGLSSIKALTGEKLNIDASNGLRIGIAMIIDPDIECSNGIIHIIDNVMLPAAMREMAASMGREQQ